MEIAEAREVASSGNKKKLKKKIFREKSSPCIAS